MARSQSHVIHDNIPDTGCAERMVCFSWLTKAHCYRQWSPVCLRGILDFCEMKQHQACQEWSPQIGWLRDSQSLCASRNNGRSLRRRICSYLLTYHSTPHATIGVQPCKLMVQRDLRTRFNFLIPNCARSALGKQSQQNSAHDYVSCTREWKAGDKVMVRNLCTGP